MTRSAERRSFLEGSLDDLEEEHAAGDLSDADYERLRTDYLRRLAELDRGPAPAARPAHRSTTSRVVRGLGVVAFAVLAGVLLAQAVGRRSPGGTITGIDVAGRGRPTTTTAPAEPEVADDLARCFALATGEAFDCYIAYTRANPDDADGFLYFGLFSVQQGLQSDSEELLSGGETFLRRALEIDPAKLAARVNLAVLLERTGRDDEARAELAQLDGVELPDDLQALVDFVESNLEPG